MVQILDASGSKLMVQYPKLKSRDVAKVKPSNSCNTVLILGIGNGFQTSLLFTSLKSLIIHTVLYFLGIMNDGDAHSDAG